MFIYVPTFGGVVSLKDYPKKLLWWTKNAIFKYKAVLISYGMLELSAVTYNWREEAFVDDDVLVIGDSGGFQMASKGKYINPIDVINWQLKNVDIAFPLDLPAKTAITGKPMTIDEFVECAKITAKNIDIIYDIVKSSRIRFYLILHGNTNKKKEAWWKIAVEPYLDIADGIAVGTDPPSSYKQVMIDLGYMYEKGIENVHILGVGGFKTMIPMVYYSDKFKLLTTDSSTPLSMIGRATIMIPGDHRKIRIGRVGLKKNINFNNLLCNCPACTEAKKDGYTNIFDLSHKEKIFYVRIHNLFWYITFIDKMHWLKESNKLFDYAKEKGVDLTFLDDVEDLGFERAYRKHFERKGLGRWL